MARVLSQQVIFWKFTIWMKTIVFFSFFTDIQDFYKLKYRLLIMEVWKFFQFLSSELKVKCNEKKMPDWRPCVCLTGSTISVKYPKFLQTLKVLYDILSIVRGRRKSLLRNKSYISARIGNRNKRGYYLSEESGILISTGSLHVVYEGYQW